MLRSVDGIAWYGMAWMRWEIEIEMGVQRGLPARGLIIHSLHRSLLLLFFCGELILIAPRGRGGGVEDVITLLGEMCV